MIYKLDIVSRKDALRIMKFTPAEVGDLAARLEETFNVTTWVSSDSALDGIKEDVEEHVGRDVPFILVVNPSDNGGNTQLFFPELTYSERELVVDWLMGERLTFRTAANE